jgi:hypothetical protein
MRRPLRSETAFFLPDHKTSHQKTYKVTRHGKQVERRFYLRASILQALHGGGSRAFKILKEGLIDA